MLRWVRPKTYPNFRTISHLLEEIAQDERKKSGFWGYPRVADLLEGVDFRPKFLYREIPRPHLYNKHKVSFEWILQEKRYREKSKISIFPESPIVRPQFLPS